MTVYILHFIALVQTFSFRFYANNSLVSVFSIGMIMERRKPTPQLLLGQRRNETGLFLA